MNDIILSPVPLAELIAQIREVVKEEFKAEQEKQTRELIGPEELCRRLGISAPTEIKYRKQGRIPFIQLGDSIRFDWDKVLTELEKTKKK